MKLPGSPPAVWILSAAATAAVCFLALGHESSAEKTPRGAAPGSAPAPALEPAREGGAGEITPLLRAVRSRIESFRRKEGRYPRSLEELDARDGLGALPAPGSGRRLLYDPETGQLEAGEGF